MSATPISDVQSHSGTLKSRTIAPIPISKAPNILHNSHFPAEFRTRIPPDAAHIPMREAAATAFRYHDMRAEAI